MKRSVNILLVALLGLSIILAGSIPNVSAQPLGAQEGETTATRKVTVSGTGRVTSDPDSTVLRLGVSTQAEEAAEALEQNNEQTQALIDALVDAGIPEDEIETVRFNMFPRYSDRLEQNQQQEITGYEVSNVLQVRVDGTEQVGELLDAAVQAGANTVESIQFEISESANLVDQARQAAMQDARSKAEQLADLADAELGIVLEIQETGFTPGVVLGRGMALEEAAAAPIQPGQQEVTVQLTVIWELQ